MSQDAPFRSYILNCVRSDNDLPAAYRWLYRNHVEDSISKLRPYCSSYCTYRALPVPPEGKDFGTYNWIMTEHHWLINPSKYWGPEGRINAFGERFGREFLEITRQPTSNGLRDSKWQGTRDGYHPIVYIAAPLFWEKDFKGSTRTVDDGPNYRWLIVFKYPQSVSREEGDDWFMNKLAPQIKELPQVNRFITSKVIDNGFIKGPWHRVAEIWFDNSEKWYEAMVENANKFEKPAWANWNYLPYFEPYVDFTGVFLLDRPESDHLNQFAGYITTR